MHLHNLSATTLSPCEWLKSTRRSTKKLISCGVDAALSLLAFSFARVAVSSSGLSELDLSSEWQTYVLIPICTLLAFMGVGVYRWIVSSTTLGLLTQIAKGGMLASILCYLGMLVVDPQFGPSLSLVSVFGISLTCFAVMARGLWLILSRRDADGAGTQGQDLVSLLKIRQDRNPVIFIDSNPTYKGATIAGLPVISFQHKKLVSLLHVHKIEQIILADLDLRGVPLLSLHEFCSQHNLSLRKVPPMSDVLLGNSRLYHTREIEINDLLGRKENLADKQRLKQSVKGKFVLITGGGGSIGSEICRQIISQAPAGLVVVEQSEENLYTITEEIQQRLNASKDANDIRFIPVLGSVTNANKLDHLLGEYPIDVIYHAAAYKHVPIVESAPTEGFHTNVMGTLNVLELAIAHKVEQFVMISTDKAVRPTNVMGATKRLAEMVLQAKAALGGDTRICMVRFGNVLGSSGSVVPKFRSQIERGDPITITHPDIERYFMTIPEASQLVLLASSLCTGGEVFVLDMGKPVRISDLAKNMVTLSGKRLKTDDYKHGDIEIQYIGLRPGEKMYEELFLGDNIINTQVDRVMVAHETYLPWKQLKPIIYRLNQLAELDESSMLANEIHRTVTSEADVSVDNSEVGA